MSADTFIAAGLSRHDLIVLHSGHFWRSSPF